MRKKKKGLGLEHKIFFVLCVIVLLLGTANIVKAKGFFIPVHDEIKIIDNTIILESMDLEQKIAQMVVVHGGDHNLEAWRRMQLGGIHLFAKENEEGFAKTIRSFQDGVQIPFIVTVDLEGCHNPFSHFKEFIPSANITTETQAYEKGVEEGEFLKDLGFTLNFAPVVDLDDQIWKCRAFPGSEEEVALLAQSYVEGIQSTGIIATAKHYPGQTLTSKDPHKFVVGASITQKDLFPYSHLSSIVDGVMVSHIITDGALDSNGIPAVSSQSVIRNLEREFEGLIITDEINMLGLRDFYPTLDAMYIAVFSAGNDIVINFAEDPNEIHHMIQVVAQAVNENIIPQNQIDESVRKILIAKGFEVE